MSGRPGWIEGGPSMFDTVQALYAEMGAEPMPTPDPVNAPEHYRSHPSGIECIEVTEHLSFLRGNAIKYLWRAGSKGDAVTDLRKAVFYINREIANLEKDET